jgi:hypothetical protein
MRVYLTRLVGPEPTVAGVEDDDAATDGVLDALLTDVVTAEERDAGGAGVKRRSKAGWKAAWVDVDVVVDATAALAAPQLADAPMLRYRTADDAAGAGTLNAFAALHRALIDASYTSLMHRCVVRKPDAASDAVRPLIPVTQLRPPPCRHSRTRSSPP